MFININFLIYIGYLALSSACTKQGKVTVMVSLVNICFRNRLGAVSFWKWFDIYHMKTCISKRAWWYQSAIIMPQITLK